MELLVVLANGALALLFVVPAQARLRGLAERTKCQGNLRQLGLAAIQYVDDKRFFPHVGPLLALDGDWETSDPSKALRALLWYGYLDSPEVLVCPASEDRPRPALQEGRTDRRWFWSSWRADGAVVGGGGAGSGDPLRSPFVDGLPDHSLDGTDEASYGWTRRGLNGGVRSTVILYADRSLRDGAPSPRRRGELGNHRQGWNLVQADASTLWLSLAAPEGGDPRALADTTRAGAALAMQDPASF